MTSVAPQAPGSWQVTPLIASAIACPSASLCVAAASDADVGGDGDLLTSTDPADAASWQSTHIDDNQSCDHHDPQDCSPALETAVSCASVRLCVVGDSIGATLGATNPAGGAAAWHEDGGTGGGYGVYALTCASSLCLAGDPYSGWFTVVGPLAPPGQQFITLGGSQGGGTTGLWCASAQLCFDAIHPVDDFRSPARIDLWVSTNPTGPASAWTLSESRPGGVQAMSCPTATTCYAGLGSGALIIGSPLIAPARVTRLLRDTLTPRGSAAQIARLLHHNGQLVRLRVPEPGRLTVRWTQRSHAHRLLARGSATATATGTVTLAVRLTPAARRLLRHARQVPITMQATFHPNGNPAVSSFTKAVLSRPG